MKFYRQNNGFSSTYLHVYAYVCVFQGKVSTRFIMKSNDLFEKLQDTLILFSKGIGSYHKFTHFEIPKKILNDNK